MTVYVEQPKENSEDLMGPNSVGHVFVGIEQDGKRRLIGYYPPATVSRLGVATGKDYTAEIRDNSGHQYHVSISTTVTSWQMRNIISYAENFPKTYNLNKYACTEFGIVIGNLAGLNLPSTTVKHPLGLFEGRLPGKLGQEIRERNSGNGKTIVKKKGKAPNKINEKC